MHTSFNKNYKMALVFELYLIGRRLVYSSRIKNMDQLLKIVILLILVKQSMSVSELANKISIKLSTVSEKINALKKEGLLFKTKVNDSRVRVLNITDKGKDVINSFNNKLPINELEKKVTLSKDETTLLMSLLTKIRV